MKAKTSMVGDPKRLERIMEILSRAGDYADVFREDTEGLSVVHERGRIERIGRTRDAGVALRIIADGRTFFAHAAETADLESLARDLVRQADSRSDGAVIDAAAHPPIVNLGADDASGFGEDVTERIAILESMDAEARRDAAVSRVISAWRETKRDVRILTSAGQDRSQVLTYATAVSHVIAESGGVVQTGYESDGGIFDPGCFRERIDTDALAATARRRAVQNIGAPRVKAGRMPVVIAACAGGTFVHEAIGHGLEADFVDSGMSVYAGRIGETVASPLVSVVDDATIAFRRGSFAFDDEGVDATRTELVKDGVLAGYMYDRVYAMRAGTSSTGNGRRESWRSLPLVRMTNTMILPGASDPESIIASVPSGLYVVKMGGGEVNTVNGDFVFEVNEGYAIENGRISRPVRNATLIGNGPAVLASIDMVGSDLGFSLGTCGKDGQGVPVADAEPTIRIPEITVGGKQ